MLPEKPLSTKRILPITGIILVWGILFIPGLGLKELWNPLEPRYAAVAKEMYETKQFFIPHYLGEVYLEKPPLYFWLVDLSFYLTGTVAPWSALLPSYLASIGSLLLIYLIGANLFSTGGGLIAAALTLFNIRFAYQSNRIQMEIVLLFFILLAIYAFIKWKNKRHRVWLLLFYFTLGLSILTKGLIGAVPVLISAIIYTLLDNDIKLKELRLPTGIFVMAEVLACWLIPVFVVELGHEEAHALFMNGVGKFVTESSKHSIFYYFRILPTEFAPWTILAIPALFDRGRAAIRDKDKASSLLLVILISFFVFLSINSKRHSHYSLLMIPVLSLIIGYWFEKNIGKRLINILIRCIAFLSLCAIPLFLATYLIFPHFLKNSVYNWITPHILNLPVPLLLFFLGIGGLICAWGAFRERINLRMVYTGISIYFCAIIFFLNVPITKAFDPIKSNARVRETLSHLDAWHTMPVGTFGFLNNSESLLGWFYFYTDKVFIRLNDRDIESKSWLLKHKNNHLLLFEQDLDRVKRGVPNLKIITTFDFGKDERIFLVRKGTH